MHNFFGVPPLPFQFRSRLYARLIDWEKREYALFDCVDADFFDQLLELSNGEVTPELWGAHIERAQIFAIEVNPLSEPGSAAQTWLEKNAVETMPEWLELTVAMSADGPAEVYNNIAGAPLRTSLEVRAPSATATKALRQAVDLTNDVTSDTNTENALPTATIQQVFVLDVGQGAANALVDTAGEVVAYVDLGAGILKNTGTWPSSHMQICLAKRPHRDPHALALRPLRGREQILPAPSPL